MIKPREELENIKPYLKPDESRREKLRFDFNENNWGCSPKVLEAIRALEKDDFLIYPTYQGLLEKLAAKESVSIDSILLTNGSNGSIRAVVDAYIENGDEIILPHPTFSFFYQCCGMRGGVIKKVDYNPDFSFPIERVLNSITEKTKMVVLVNPNSPTGTLIGEEQIRSILEKAQNAMIVMDEAYYQYAKKSHIHLVKEFRNLIVIRTFSKAYGLASLRIGYSVSSPENIQELRKVVQPFPANMLAVIAACAALDDQEYYDKVIDEALEEKGRLITRLNEMGIETVNTSTNFILVKFGEESDNIYQSLREEGIYVRNMNNYELLKGYLRITTGRPFENDILIQKISELLPPEAIIFDMDGVLVDVSSSYRVAIKETAEHFLNKDISFQEIQEYKNKGGYNNDWNLTEAIILSKGVTVSKEDIIAKFQEYYLGANYDGLISNEKWVFDKELARMLKGRYKLGIFTGRPRKEAELTLSRSGMEEMFDVLIALEDVPLNREKPDPFGIQKALELLQVKRAMYIGDTIDDVKAAVASGVTPVGISNETYRNDDILKEAGAKYILNNINEIRGIL